MKAVLVRGYGDVNQLYYGDAPDLTPGPGEVLVRMLAKEKPGSAGSRFPVVLHLHGVGRGFSASTLICTCRCCQS
jgi:hypothetical protein